MKRRTYIASALATVTAIAGCGSPGAGVEETETEPGVDGEQTESPIPTETETDTPTETEAGTPTETEAGTESPTMTEAGTESPTGTATGGATTTVQMVTDGDEFIFDPIGVAIEPGTTVEWVLESGSHSSTAYEDRIPDGAEAWDSGTLSETGASFSHTFETEGTYDYFCTPHKTLGMVGRLVVGEPGGPAEGSMPPDGEVPESQRIVDEGSVSYDDFAGG